MITDVSRFGSSAALSSLAEGVEHVRNL